MRVGLVVEGWTDYTFKARREGIQDLILGVHHRGGERLSAGGDYLGISGRGSVRHLGDCGPAAGPAAAQLVSYFLPRVWMTATLAFILTGATLIVVLVVLL